MRRPQGLVSVVYHRILADVMWCRFLVCEAQESRRYYLVPFFVVKITVETGQDYRTFHVGVVWSLLCTVVLGLGSRTLPYFVCCVFVWKSMLKQDKTIAFLFLVFLKHRILVGLKRCRFSGFARHKIIVDIIWCRFVVKIRVETGQDCRKFHGWCCLKHVVYRCFLVSEAEFSHIYLLLFCVKIN